MKDEIVICRRCGAALRWDIGRHLCIPPVRYVNDCEKCTFREVTKIEGPINWPGWDKKYP